MNRRIKIALGALLPALIIAACDDFLTGPKLGDDDPNRALDANREQRFMAVQASQFIQQTGSVARTAAMWTQQMAGTGQQYLTIGTYAHNENTFSGEFSRVYSRGGLIDIRAVIDLSETDGDRIYGGIAKVWEALIIGTAASIWGDIPYSEAVGEIATPKLDEQAAIYAEVQSLLDEAIADLESGEGTGPGDADLVYSGDPRLWIEAAHTLKARYYMHWAEADPSSYGNALAQAAQGIASPEGDFRTYHSTTPGEQNVWYQFINVDRPGYIRAGRFLVDLLSSRDDPRLSEYFAPSSNGDYAGAAPNEQDAGQSQLSDTRGSQSFRQPIMTWAEGQLIIAEAEYRVGAEANALAALNDVRADAGLPAISPSGTALLEEIMTEKYIRGFQNIEAWNDYKRTCLPAFTPYEGGPVPGRLFYGFAERNTNPNIPEPAQQPQRNDNDPSAC